jgi:lipoate-protein ligase A
LKTRSISTIIEKSHNPIKNLAREELLFRQVDGRSLPEVVRFWVNSECLVKGKARNPRYGWYHEKLAEELGVPVLERSTGGGVVYHDEGNLNWSFYFGTEGAFLSPTTLFRRGSNYLIKALWNLGVEAVFSPPNRIDVRGRKVSGMAARSTKKTALVHGTLLLSSDLDKLNRLCIPPLGSPPVANLTEWKRDIGALEVMEEVLAVLRESGFSVKKIRR